MSVTVLQNDNLLRKSTIKGIGAGTILTEDMWLSVSKLTLVFSVFLQAYCQAAEDYYKTLGLSDTASIPEVKKAFRSLAKTMHPDKNKEPGAEAKFRKLLEAYEVLSDETKKRDYDAMRRHRGRGGGTNNSGESFKWDSFGRGTRARNFDFDFSELFKQFESDIWDDHFGGNREAKEEHFESHFNSHFQAHHHSKFHGSDSIDLGGDFFHEFDGDNLFGDMKSFFGDLDVESHFSERSHTTHAHKRRQQKCHTVKQKIGNTVTTYTQCS